ncbi:hypothetical protein [Caballeronia sp. DA-9]|uniref:hypothetical protein n=1 Tax=Caballeronia sp. DA-9 TaxID=3436237 RepID=UPI003F664D65
MPASLSQDYQSAPNRLRSRVPRRQGSCVQGLVNQRVATHRNLAKHIYYEEVGEVDVREVDYDAAGRVDLSLLVDDELVETADFYVCGPTPFTVARCGKIQLGASDVRLMRSKHGSKIVLDRFVADSRQQRF